MTDVTYRVIEKIQKRESLLGESLRIPYSIAVYADSMEESAATVVISDYDVIAGNRFSPRLFPSTIAWSFPLFI